jgi:hypothetical protein
MTAHRHQFRLIDTDRTYKTTARKQSDAGNLEFAKVLMPLWNRKCACGRIEELRNGNWQEISTQTTTKGT